MEPLLSAPYGTDTAPAVQYTQHTRTTTTLPRLPSAPQLPVEVRSRF